MDLAGDALVAGHQLYARSGVSTGDASEKPAIYKVIGIILALSSGLFIGVSFVVKKKGLLAANEKYSEEAGEGYGYLKNWMWWTGMTLMIIGEVCNFVAYAFVDAILVTPMGALAVVVTAILSAIFLKERLSFVGKVGCFNCIVGSVVIVINAPEQSSVSTIQDLQKLAITPGFLSYTGVIILIALFLAVWAAPRYGKKTMMVDISICSLIGGLSVVATQGLGSAILAQIRGVAQFNQWFLYVVLVFVIATLLTEIIYLNVSLQASRCYFWWSTANLRLPESSQCFQRCAGHAHVLCVLHQCYYRHFRHPFPGLQGYRNYNLHGCDGIPANLLWRGSSAAVQVRKGRARCRRIPG